MDRFDEFDDGWTLTPRDDGSVVAEHPGYLPVSAMFSCEEVEGLVCWISTVIPGAQGEVWLTERLDDWTPIARAANENKPSARIGVAGPAG